MFKIKKLNTDGFSHHFLVPILVIALIAAAGSYVVMQSRASVAYTNGPIYTGNSFISPDGSKEDRVSYNNVAATNEWIQQPVFNADGSKIAVVAKQGDTNNYTLKTILSDGTQSKEIYKPTTESIAIAGGGGISRPTWSSDGKYIAFLQTEQGGPFAYDPDGGFASRQGLLTVVRTDGVTGAEDSYRTFSMFPEEKPEGNSWFSQSGVQFMPGTTKITYIASLWDENSQLCTIDITAESEPTCKIITGVEGDYNIPQLHGMNFRVSNRGEALFTGSKAHPSPDQGYDEQYYKLNLNTARATALGSARSATRHNSWYNFDIEWSPDGRYIAYQHDPYTVSEPAMAGTFVMDSNGGNLKKISEESYQLTWQPIPVGGTQSSLPSSPQNITCSVSGPDGGFTPGMTNQKIKVTVNNHGLSPVSTTISGTYMVWTPSQNETPLVPVTTPQIKPDGSTTVTLPITIPTAVNSFDSLNINLKSGGDTYCGYGSFPLPLPVISLDTPSDTVVRYSKQLTVKGRTTSPNAPLSLEVASYGSNYGKSDKLGNFTIKSSVPKDTTYYVSGGGAQSPTHSAKVAPMVSGAETRTVKKNTTAVISGKYVPNSTLKLHMRKPGDKAGTYPDVQNVKVDKYGAFSVTYKASTTKAFYISAPNGTKSPVYTYKIK